MISQGGFNISNGADLLETLAPFQVQGAGSQNVDGLYPESATTRQDTLIGRGPSGPSTDSSNPSHSGYNVVIWDRILGQFRAGEAGYNSTIMTNSTNEEFFGSGVTGQAYSYSTTSGTSGLATDLKGLGANSMVIIWTKVDGKVNRFGTGNDLLEAMKYCGAANAVFGAGGSDDAASGSPGFKHKSAYTLIGVPGQGEGSGVELYSGDIDSDPGAWTEASITFLSNSHAMISGSSSHGLMTEENINQLQADVFRAQSSADREINVFYGLAADGQLNSTGNLSLIHI